LFTPATLLAGDLTVQNTTGTFFYDFAVSFKYNGSTVTGISHKTTDGCVSELVNNLSEISVEIEQLKFLVENSQAGTSYTLTLDDVFKGVTMSSSSANTVNIPLNSIVPFPTGTQIIVHQIGVGATSITGASGVTINGSSGGTVTLADRWGAATLWKRGTNTWSVIGGVA